MRSKPVILVVEDSEGVSPVQFILSHTFPCEMLTARSSTKAWDITLQKQPDLIIYDVTSQEASGFSFCQQLKADEDLEDIALIFLSATENTQSIVLGLGLGAVDFIRKPFYPKEIVARVQTQLKLRAQKDLIRRQNLENRELLQVLCHDLANQHCVISGYLSLAEMNPENAGSYHKQMGQTLATIADMIALVRKFQSLQDGKSTLSSQPVALKSAVRDALLILAHRMEEKQISVQVEVPDEILVLVEKVSFINSVLCNLLSNAAKFSFPGGKITIGFRKSQNGKAVLTIQDQGIGMPPDIRRDLFRINKPTSRPGTCMESGTGYGLPLVRKFMEMYQGHVAVESVEKGEGSGKHGTTVTLTLMIAGET